MVWKTVVDESQFAFLDVLFDRVQLFIYRYLQDKKMKHIRSFWFADVLQFAEYIMCCGNTVSGKILRPLVILSMGRIIVAV